MKYPFLRIAAALCTLAAPSLAQDPALVQHLRGLDTLRTGTLENALALEHECLALLQQQIHREDLGVVLAQIAIVHAQASLARPEKVVEFAKLALNEPLEPRLRARLHVHLADALEVQHLEVGGDLPESDRLAVVDTCLRGLAPLLARELPDARPPIPGVPPMPLGLAPGSVAAIEAERLHRERLEERENALFVDELVLLRDVLVSKCARLGPEGTPARADLSQRAAAALGGPKALAAFERLLRSIRE